MHIKRLITFMIGRVNNKLPRVTLGLSATLPIAFKFTSTILRSRSMHPRLVTHFYCGEIDVEPVIYQDNFGTGSSKTEG